MSPHPRTPTGPAPADYSNYLDLDAAPAIRPRTDQPAEAVFIAAHQQIEAGLRSVLLLLTQSRDLLLAGEPAAATRQLRRAALLTDIDIQVLAAFPSLITGTEFAAFRGALGAASGLQSPHYRLIEFVSGWRDHRLVARLPHLPETRRRQLAQAAAEPSLWQAWLAAAGLAEADQPRRAAGIDQVLAAGGPLAEAADALRQHDLLWSRWRHTHMTMVAAIIGAQTAGTGGTDGVAWLAERVEIRWYPELHAAQLRTSGAAA